MFSLWLLLAGFTGISTAELPLPVLDWVGEGEVVLTAGKRSTVQILNRADFPVDVRLSLIWSEEGEAKRPKEFIPEPATDQLKPGAVATFSLAPVKEEATGSYTGILLVRAYRSGVMVGSIRRNVTFSVQEDRPDPPKLRFLTSEIKLRKYLIFHWGDPIEGAFVPLKSGADAPDPLPEAFLREEHGDIVKVRFNKPYIHRKSGLKILPVKNFSDFGQIGTYSGALEATSDGTDDLESKSTTIYITTAHHPLFAIVAIVAALVLALGVQRYTGVLRSCLKLRQHVAEIGASFNQKDYAGYSITMDVQVHLEGLLADIESLRKSSFTSLDETSPTYFIVQGEIEFLDSVVKTWNGFGAKIKLLEEALDLPVWDQVSVPPFEGMPSRPGIHCEKHSLLTGRPITANELKILAAQISEAPATLELWKNLNERAGMLARQIEALFHRLGSLGEDSRLEVVRERIGGAKEYLLPLWNRLWTDPTPDLAAENERLEEIEGNLWIEEDLFQIAKAAQAASYEARAMLAEKAWNFELFRELTTPKATPVEPQKYEQLARFLRTRSRTAEIAISILAFLIALYTGMKAEYFDQPFGTWRDYLDIVVWAVTAQTLSDLLLRTLDRLWALGGAVRTRPLG